MPDHHCVIIGAGFSGIGAAIKLDEAGLHDYLIVEAGTEARGNLVLEHLPRHRCRHPVVLLSVLLRTEPALVAYLRPRP